MDIEPRRTHDPEPVTPGAVTSSREHRKQQMLAQSAIEAEIAAYRSKVILEGIYELKEQELQADGLIDDEMKEHGKFLRATLTRAGAQYIENGLAPGAQRVTYTAQVETWRQ